MWGWESFAEGEMGTPGKKKLKSQNSEKDENRGKSPGWSDVFRGRSSRWGRWCHFLGGGASWTGTGLHLGHGLHTHLGLGGQEGGRGMAGVGIGKFRGVSREARLKIFLGCASYKRGFRHHRGSKTEDHLISSPITLNPTFSSP